MEKINLTKPSSERIASLKSSIDKTTSISLIIGITTLVDKSF